MTRVMFLHGANDRLHAAAQWLSTELALGRAVMVYVPDPDHATRLDRLLWEHSPTGFMPHCSNGGTLSSETPILLCGRATMGWLHPVVLNLSDELPAQINEIDQLVEIVSQDAATRTAGRKRYRAYQEAGFFIEAHSIEKSLST